MTTADAVNAARRHAAARYLGMPMFTLGALGLLAALYAWLAAAGTGGGVMLYLGATGLSLGTFGTHNDTALARMVQAGREALPPPLAAELGGELERDRQATLDLSATPKIAWGITLVALAFHAFAGWRLAAAMIG